MDNSELVSTRVLANLIQKVYVDGEASEREPAYFDGVMDVALRIAKLMNDSQSFLSETLPAHRR